MSVGVVADRASEHPPGVYVGQVERACKLAFEGSAIAADVGDGISAELIPGADGSTDINYSDGTHLVLRPDGTGVVTDQAGASTEFRLQTYTDGTETLIDSATGEPLDLAATLSSGSTAIGTVGSAIERGARALPTGTHHAGPSVSKGIVNNATDIGKRWGYVGMVLEVGSGAYNIIVNDAPIPETVGRSGGAIAGGAGLAWAGAGIGTAVGGPVGAVIGGGIGAFVGSGAGAWTGEKIGGLGRKRFGG